MHTIYRNSYFTIIAACADSTYEGFLKQIREQRVPTTHIPFPCPDGTMGSVWLEQPIKGHPQDDSCLYLDLLEPITHRGWCYQEKILPPRSLIFGSDMLKYYCQTETVGIGGSLCEPNTGLRLPNSAYMQNVMLSEQDQKAYRQAWQMTILMYTQRSISVPSDKLPALAGVAELFQNVTSDQYLAGLWRKTLLSDLLWATGGNNSRPAEYRAPSWSWASVDGTIVPDYRVGLLVYPKSEDDTRHLCTATVLACDVDIWSEKAPFGRVTGGTLTLSGLIREVRLEKWNKLTVEVNGKLVCVGSASIDIKEEKEECIQAPLYAIPIIWDASGSFFLGIVVVIADSAGRFYKRVGLFEESSAHKDVSWLLGLEKQKIFPV